VSRPLSVRDVGELLQRSPRARDVVLVGGQALNLWAVWFGLAEQASAVSRDIDFLGSRADAVAAGLDWHAAVNTASLDDHTSNAATVVVTIDDEAHGIDFLSSLAGVESAELRRWAGKVRSGGYEFRVMHPLHVLQSQLENVYGVLRRRDEQDGDYYIGRVALAIDVAAAATVETLEAGRPREALKVAERVAAIAAGRPALAAWSRDKIDVLAAIPAHHGWSKRFVEARRPQIEADVLKRRDRLARRSR
jgi:hypothetical protein